MVTIRKLLFLIIVFLITKDSLVGMTAESAECYVCFKTTELTRLNLYQCTELCNQIICQKCLSDTRKAIIEGDVKKPFLLTCPFCRSPVIERLLQETKTPQAVQIRLQERLKEAVNNNDLPTIRTLLAQHKDVMALPENTQTIGEMLLAYAVERNNEDIVNTILDILYPGSMRTTLLNASDPTTSLLGLYDNNQPTRMINYSHRRQSDWCWKCCFGCCCCCHD